MKFGFIGIGLMGGPLAKNLVRAGKEVYFTAKNKQHIDSVLEAGPTAHFVESAAELKDVDVLFTCLPNPKIVKEVVLESGLLASMKSGSSYVDTSTIDPKTGLELEAAAKDKGIGFLASTLGMGPAAAEEAIETMFTGGDRSVYDAMLPVLEIIGKPVYLGGVKQAYAFKIISNMVGMTNLAVLAEGIHLAEHAGIEKHQFLELLAETGADSNQLHRRGPLIVDGDFANRFAVDLALKDIRLGCEMAEDMGYFPKYSELSVCNFQKASDEGHGGEDCCAVYKALKGDD